MSHSGGALWNFGSGNKELKKMVFKQTRDQLHSQLHKRAIQYFGWINYIKQKILSPSQKKRCLLGNQEYLRTQKIDKVRQSHLWTISKHDKNIKNKNRHKKKNKQINWLKNS